MTDGGRGRQRLGVVCTLVVIAAGCAVAHRPPPAPSVPVLVPGPPSAYASMTVVAAGRSADVPTDLRRMLAPFLVARVFPASEPLAGYGLDHPVAGLHYVRAAGGQIDVAFGSPTFDRHFVYAQRGGQADIALVAASVADPLLALVGVEVPAPS